MCARFSEFCLQDIYPEESEVIKCKFSVILVISTSPSIISIVSISAFLSVVHQSLHPVEWLLLLPQLFLSSISAITMAFYNNIYNLFKITSSVSRTGNEGNYTFYSPMKHYCLNIEMSHMNGIQV